jgi:hypothetical protein
MALNVTFEVPALDMWCDNSVHILVRDTYGNESTALVVLPPGAQPGTLCAVEWQSFSAAELLDAKLRCTPIKPPPKATTNPPAARLTKKRRIARVEALMGAADETTALALSAHRLAVATTISHTFVEDEHRSPTSTGTQSGEMAMCTSRRDEDEPLYIDAPTDDDDEASRLAAAQPPPSRERCGGLEGISGLVSASILERALLRPMEGQMLRFANADRAHALRACLLCVERTRQSCSLALPLGSAASSAAVGVGSGGVHYVAHTAAAKDAADAQLLLDALNYTHDNKSAASRAYETDVDWADASLAEQQLRACSVFLDHEHALLTRALIALNREAAPVARTEQVKALQPIRHHADMVRQATQLRRILALVD